MTIPGHSTKSLRQLGITTAKWPVITTVETPHNQDACEGALLILHDLAVGT